MFMIGFGSLLAFLFFRNRKQQQPPPYQPPPEEEAEEEEEEEFIQPIPEDDYYQPPQEEPEEEYPDDYLGPSAEYVATMTNTELDEFYAHSPHNVSMIYMRTLDGRTVKVDTSSEYGQRILRIVNDISMHLLIYDPAEQYIYAMGQVVTIQPTISQNLYGKSLIRGKIVGRRVSTAPRFVSENRGTYPGWRTQIRYTVPAGTIEYQLEPYLMSGTTAWYPEDELQLRIR